MAEIFLDGQTATPEDALSSLAQHGVVVLGGHATVSDAVHDEFARIMLERKGDPSSLSINRSRVARLSEPLPERWTALRPLLYSPFISEVAKGFYGPHQFHLNSQIYLTHDVDATEFNKGWHCDPSRVLKFMLYLNDVSEKNGAMQYIPGSNYHGIYRINYNRLMGDDAFPVFLPPDEVPAGAVSLNGKAGTLIIFDTAGFHTAGNVEPGTERLVIRGHTYPKKSLRTRIGDRLRTSALNFLRRIQTDDNLVADRFKPAPTKAP